MVGRIAEPHIADIVVASTLFGDKSRTLKDRRDHRVFDFVFLAGMDEAGLDIHVYLLVSCMQKLSCFYL